MADVRNPPTRVSPAPTTRPGPSPQVSGWRGGARAGPANASRCRGAPTRCFRGGAPQKTSAGAELRVHHVVILGLGLLARVRGWLPGAGTRVSPTRLSGGA